MLRAVTSQLLAIDIQEKLLPAMAEPREVLDNALKLVKAAAYLEVPITVTEQYPRGIGATQAELKTQLPASAKLFEKLHFSALKEADVAQEIGHLRQNGRQQAVICGIEAHICVLQTALDLLASGFAVYVVSDAVSARVPASKTVALARLQQAGAQIVTTEMVIFEWLEKAGSAAFKALLPLIK